MTTHTSQIKALLPCPFCESSDVFVERETLSSCLVVCNECGTHGPASCPETDDDVKYEDEHELHAGHCAAVRLWNARPALKALVEEVERLKEFCGLYTGFDVTDPKQNAARYDGYLDGIQVGLEKMDEINEALQAKCEEQRKALEAIEQYLSSRGIVPHKTKHYAELAREALNHKESQ